MSPLMYPSTDAYLQVQYLDPIDFEVNSIENYMDWEYDDSNNKVYYVYGDITRYWLSASGWEHDTGYDEQTWGYLSSQQSVYVESSSHFTNDDFCVGQPTTHTYYYDNRIHGYDDGTSGYTVSTSKSGGCSSWLHREINLYN